jgi:hypothetical protein
LSAKEIGTQTTDCPDRIGGPQGDRQRFAQRLLADRQRELENGLGPPILALVLVKSRQIVEAGGHVWVLRPQGLFPDRQRTLAKGLGLRPASVITLTRV